MWHKDWGLGVRGPRGLGYYEMWEVPGISFEIRLQKAVKIVNVIFASPSNVLGSSEESLSGFVSLFPGRDEDFRLRVEARGGGGQALVVVALVIGPLGKLVTDYSHEPLIVTRYIDSTALTTMATGSGYISKER